MDTIVPCRDLVSERFPIASFTVRVPARRFYEIACATDPRLFHTDHARARTPENFFSSRLGGLLMVDRDGDTYMLPSAQLRRFAGSRRIYYALGTYAGRGGEDARFSIAPHALEQVPSISLSPDFTGRTLDRARIGASATSVYGGAGAELRWGGDALLSQLRRQEERAPYGGEYDDGFDPELWRGEPPSYEAFAFDDAHVPATDPDGEGEDEPQGALEDPAGSSTLASQPADDEADDQADEHEPGVEPSVAAPAYPDEAYAYDDDEDERDAADDDDDATWGGSAMLGEGRPPAYRPPPIAPTSLAYGGALAASGRHPDYREDDDDALDDEPSLPVGPAAYPLGAAPLTISRKVEILRVVARAESGDDGYSAVNPDREYEDPDHPAYHRYHIGLSWGFVQFTQRGGALGRVLRKAKEREERLQPPHAPEGSLPAEHRFDTLFGDAWRELLTVTDRELTRDPEARVAPVAGAVLWQEPWLSRFRAAGAVPYVQAAQNEVAVVDYFDRVLPMARWLQLTTSRGLALLVDRAIHMGVGGGRRWIMDAIGPIRTEADRAAALRALGHADDDLRAFQAATPDLEADGRWGPMTHAAMVAMLRTLGERSPVRVPGPQDIVRALGEAAERSGFGARVRALLDDQRDLDDAITYELS